MWETRRRGKRGRICDPELVTPRHNLLILRVKKRFIRYQTKIRVTRAFVEHLGSSIIATLRSVQHDVVMCRQPDNFWTRSSKYHDMPAMYLAQPYWLTMHRLQDILLVVSYFSLRPADDQLSGSTIVVSLTVWKLWLRSKQYINIPPRSFHMYNGHGLRFIHIKKAKP